MMGTIAGDIIGSCFEFRIDRYKSKDFELFPKIKACTWTDDTVMTLATARALVDIAHLSKNKVEKKAPQIFAKYYREFGRLYPDAGYGGYFKRWIKDDSMGPYNSFGNGAAMRVSPCGLYAKTLKEAEMLGELSASVTHNHPEGIKAAKCIAGAVFLAKQGATKEKLKEYVNKYYSLSFTLEGIRPTYKFEVSCQKSVPQSLLCFFESDSYEDCMRNCVSLGGDTDTMCAIVGTIAELYFGLPEDIEKEAYDKLTEHQQKVLIQFAMILKS